MSRVYFDTNVVLYAIEERDEYARQRTIAQALLTSHIRLGTIAISTQVLQEAYDNAIRKLKRTPDVVIDFVRDLCKLNVIATDATLVLDAIAISQRYQSRVFDALMIAAAKRAGCTTLYTEDLSHGQVIDGVRIVNPFKEEPTP